ncbi:TPA: AbrB/MazE/SpoVT family DNA-binding domain-containing protein [Candidatus Micrarchaeota archaeon]|nr:AbrB/MazE/SpoVT family DNA-binding domain-containing protein [Candidatus Micrarchaeota archaeon]
MDVAISKVNSKGQITIPKAWMKELGIKYGQTVSFSRVKGEIILSAL